ncbi:MAG: glycoside hydrolase family 127 protein [Opitutaceae bacterium]|nr:glycoside hydrolase family 127 protein [Opitutaceae bacterium]
MNLKHLMIPLFLSLVVGASAEPGALRLERLPLGAIRPRGWLETQLRENLDGFIGQLDALAPDLLVADQIYGRDRLTPAVRNKDLGATGVPPDEQAQFLWWNSETQSNWKDGFIRTAAVLGDQAALARAETWVNELLATQDADGYLGIYSPELRYRFTNENGELWAKTTALRYLLAWYDYTGETRVWDAIRKAVDEVMRSYPRDASHPFRSTRASTSGLTHGLTFIDVLSELARRTGDREYADYAVWLYQEFSTQPLNEDAQLSKLLDESLPLTGHGVHTYEHLRCVAHVAHYSGDPQLKRALENFLRKIDHCRTPSGAAIGDEFIRGGRGDATARGYEYCSLHELLHSRVELLFLGDERQADEIESLFLNAAQGARHPKGEGVAYLKSDNSHAMTGPLNDDPADPHQVRYKYSPLHRDAAVCCVPNAGRIGPFLVQHAFARDEAGFVALLFGPSVMESTFDGEWVRIVADTGYPFEGSIRFSITSEKAFRFRVRKPSWCVTPGANQPFREAGNYLEFQIPAGSDSRVVAVDLAPSVVTKTDSGGELYFMEGPLVLAAEIESLEHVACSHAVGGLRDLHYRPKVSRVDYRVPASGETRREADINSNREVRLLDEDGQPHWVSLKPMGRTILRQVTFPVER